MADSSEVTSAKNTSRYGFNFVVKDYQVVSSHDLGWVAREVSRLAKGGWTPQGGISTLYSAMDADRYYQAMVCYNVDVPGCQN